MILESHKMLAIDMPVITEEKHFVAMYPSCGVHLVVFLWKFYVSTGMPWPCSANRLFFIWPKSWGWNSSWTRVDNKGEKRVSNALYALCKMSAENHLLGIQKLTNESARFKWYVVHGCGLECTLTQAWFRLKMLADNNIKRVFMKILAQNSQKTPLFFTICI